MKKTQKTVSGKAWIFF